MPNPARGSADVAEDLVLSVPEASSIDLLVTLPRPEDFFAFSKRGLFAYDGSGVHRTTRHRLGRYELQSRTKTPLVLCGLPDPLQELPAATKLSAVTFGTSAVVPRGSVGA